MSTSGNHWYHCIVSTYGSWIRGDSRGWRSKHQREHVTGDYKHPPPPGMYDAQRQESLRKMEREPILLTPIQRRLICTLIVDYLNHVDVTYADLCVSATHFHLLVKVPPAARDRIVGLNEHNALKDGRNPLPRYLLGRIKMRTSLEMRKSGHHTAPGGLWGVRSKIIPIHDRNHQLRVVRYIRNHRREGAAVWSDLKSDPPSIP
jgi:hypothetical protein